MPPTRPELRGLAANLACRARLGLGLVQGGPQELARLLALAQGQTPAPAPASPASPAALDPHEAPPSLEALRLALVDCQRCALAQGRRKVVFGSGPQGARLMLIGEAPGAQEDQQGLPFVGPAGQLLERMLAAVGLKREQVYITNIVKCRPPANRDPQPAEVAACRPFLEAQVEAVAPRLVCALGRPAAQAILETDAPISALRGSWHQWRGLRVLPTFHPAFLLRSPERKAQAYQDLKALAQALREQGS